MNYSVKRSSLVYQHKRTLNIYGEGTKQDNETLFALILEILGQTNNKGNSTGDNISPVDRKEQS